MNLVDRYIPLQQKLKQEAKDKLFEDYLTNQSQAMFIDTAQGEMLDIYGLQLGLRRLPRELDIEFRGRAEMVLRGEAEPTPMITSITQDYEPNSDNRLIRVRFSNDMNIQIVMSDWMFRNDYDFIHRLSQTIYSHTQQYPDLRLEDIEEQLARIMHR